MKAIIKSRPPRDGGWPEGLQLREVAIPSITHPEDIQVRVLAAGICGTDAGIYKSRTSLRRMMAGVAKDWVILGHEFCGAPVDAGAHARMRLARILGHYAAHDAEVGRYARGRSAEVLAEDPRLMEFIEEHFYCSAEMHVTCGWCHQCRMGERHVCQNTIIKGVHEDGAFADYVVVPASNLVLFRRNELPVDIIAFMDALGNAVHTVQSVDIAGKSVAILGSGVQGLMATAVARHSGASHIYVTDFTPPDSGGIRPIEDTLFSLARRFGADHCFDLAQPGDAERLVSRVMEETNGTGVDTVLEMSGSYGAYRNALDLVRMGGTIALLGLPEGEFSMDFSREVILRGLTIKGIIGRRVFETWEVMRNLLIRGLAHEFMDSHFISHRLKLEDYETGITAMLKRDATKVILTP